MNVKREIQKAVEFGLNVYCTKGNKFFDQKLVRKIARDYANELTYSEVDHNCRICGSNDVYKEEDGIWCYKCEKFSFNEEPKQPESLPTRPEA